MLDPKRIVAEGYDRIAERHAEWAATVRSDERGRYASILLEALPQGAEVLELGCGAVGPTTRALADRFDLTAVDISARSIELAQVELPQVQFVHADVMRVEFPPDRFDGVAAFYSIVHVPREEHGELFARVARWLRPGGWFVASIGARDAESEYDPNWLGAPMYWSGYDEPTGRRLIEATGLVIERACVETADEDGRSIPFLWIVARRPVPDHAPSHPSSADARLAEFRATFPACDLRHDGVTWRYHRGPSPGETVLWLTGVLGAGEFAFGAILELMALEPGLRVLAPDYPALPTLDRMTDGLVAILDAEQVEAAHVIGGSFSGVLAQHLVRRHPTRVRSLVLSHTGPPRRTPGHAVLIGMIAGMPERWMKGLIRRRLRGTLAGADPFWLGYFDAAIARMTKADLMSRLRLASEFGQQRHGARDLEGWPGRVLILDSSDDPLVPSRTRSALHVLYPGAELHEFSGTGHAAGVLQPLAFARRIRQFLLREA